MSIYDFQQSPWFVLLILWELGWKGFGLWRAGRDNQLYWFIAIFLINSLGILPIVYLSFFSKTKRFKATPSS